MNIRPIDLMDPEDPYECSICIESFFHFVDACHHVYHCHYTRGDKPSKHVHQRSDRLDEVERYNWIEEDFGGYPDDWEERREEVLRRDGNECVECGRKGMLHVDHIRPITRGGSHELDNLQTLCWPCHLRKHPHMENEFRKK